ncbi:phosphonate transport system permease protein [Variovorax boronicumulans]|uniref:Phosphonate transport system permease protein n=1 Tax=Variovorax boronicumulans TaxID=436515 RepID=A0AAW8D6S2_9BURK|nr:phosphonate ABC transporter, permease protein PhnE [Variovorax boronicumulans]MDP9895481.1 phosphonate transport system permease protein [Variovorax boronicumulans]MDQ0039852.1 phosphonate transport system permease protein [Variovorax boronicumulans]MDQ0055521.1 phosphonate transport system permease protein [Variovorax boronicumulans]MDQ0068860.1 phosphonate transport system permease protein [Variovorax boronicumulans]
MIAIGRYNLLVAKSGGNPGWWKYALVGLAALGVMWWAAIGSQVSFSELAKGMPWIADFLGRMLPPNWEFMQRLVKPAIETVQIALWGTLLSVILAVPLCFFAARNISPNLAVFHAMRQVLNITRGINEIILALIFVAAVGLGPFPGVLALALHGAGMLGKFFAESIEEIDQGPLEALRATGAGPIQTIIFGVIPQVVTAWIGVIVYRFETNLRQATVLGMVGAGGIGFELVGSMKLFQYQDTATCILVIVVMVMTADYLSTKLRAWIQQGAHQ